MTAVHAGAGRTDMVRPAALVNDMRPTCKPRRVLAAVLTSTGVDDDGDLVDRLRAGDEAAFVELLQRYQPRLLRLAQATVGSRAVEALLEIFLRPAGSLLPSGS